jgi:8-oxo-dGTP diphosphatase
LKVQRVTNCILLDKQMNKVLLLKKPRRGWWVAPGGKMEPSETISEAVTREFKEETGINVKDPKLRGVFTIVVENKGQVVDEWMMFTFFAEKYEGSLLEESPEGELSWQEVGDIAALPKAKGDQVFFEHILNKESVLVMKFRYTPDYELLDCE